jgi:hypothetical protein
MLRGLCGDLQVGDHSGAPQATTLKWGRASYTCLLIILLLNYCLSPRPKKVPTPGSFFVLQCSSGFKFQPRDLGWNQMQSEENVLELRMDGQPGQESTFHLRAGMVASGLIGRSTSPHAGHQGPEVPVSPSPQHTQEMPSALG